jgi:potassium efflux system protein
MRRSPAFPEVSVPFFRHVRSLYVLCSGSRRAHIDRRLLSAFACAFALWMSAPAWGADAATPPPPPEQVLETARKQIDELQKVLKKSPDEADLTQARATAQDIQTKADAAAEALTPQLTGVTARVVELGKPAVGAKEAADVASQRAQLVKNQSALDAQIKLARLLSVEAGQAIDQISSMRRTELQARLGERRDSVLGTPFWAEFAADVPHDRQRLADLGSELGTSVAETPGLVWTALLLGIVALLGFHVWASGLLLRVTAARVPAGRLRRSFFAWALVLLSVITPGASAWLLKLGITWHGDLVDDTVALLDALVNMVFFGGYVAGLGYALLSPHRPSWRLPAIPDSVALRLRWFPSVLAVVLVLIWLAERLPALINASLSTAIAVNCLVTLMLTCTLGTGMVRAKRLWRQARSGPDNAHVNPRPFWLTTILGIVWFLLIGSLICVLIGYVSLASFVVKQIAWALILLVSAYLLAVVIDDGFTTLLGAAPHEDDDNEWVASPRLRDQAAVLLSGLARLLVGLVALLLFSAPFGEGPGELAGRFVQLHNGVAIGEVQILPGAVLQAIVVLFLGLAVVKILRKWLFHRYLPTTGLDTGMRASAAALFGYAGVVVAFALSLSAIGIGLERIAWVASALSVGIGFGLQAIVQNFVSGLILLAERPVKVGDWVSLSDVEGDILRINVRATEIQMGDRSTVIVPNSEFITKNVRNVTRASPLGRVQIKLPVPLGADAGAVRELLLAALLAHADILDAPAPTVMLDGIEHGSLIFNATGFVSSPRAASATRSALLFEVLQSLADARIDLQRPAQVTITNARGIDAPVADVPDADASSVSAVRPVADSDSNGIPAENGPSKKS